MGSYIFVFVLFFASHLIHRPSIFAVADSILIEKTCRDTKYYDVCVSILKSNPTSSNADTLGLANIMVGVGRANATATSSYLSSQLISAPTNDTTLKEVLKECADKYTFAGDSLQASSQDLASENYDYASMHITAAADYPSSCHNAFRRFPGLAYPPELARREDGFKQICEVALGIIDQLISNS